MTKSTKIDLLLEIRHFLNRIFFIQINKLQIFCLK